MDSPIIPKPLKRFKGQIFMSFTWYDLGIFALLTVLVILCWGLFALSYWPLFSLAISESSLGIFLVLPINDVKGYVRIYRFVKFIFSKKKYVNKQIALLNPYKDIEEDGYIKLNNGTYILPIEVQGFNISILQEKEQLSRINSFQEFLKANQKTFSLIKCTLPNDLSSQKDLLEGLHSSYKKEKNKDLLKATEQNLDVLTKLEQKELNYSDKYFVLIFGSKKSIEDKKQRLISYLRNSYLEPQQVSKNVSTSIINSFYELKPLESIDALKQITFKRNHYVVSKTINNEIVNTYTRVIAIQGLPRYASLGWLDNINQGDNCWSMTLQGFAKAKAAKKIDKVIKKLEEEMLSSKKASQSTQQQVYLEGIRGLNERLHANGELIHSTYTFIKIQALSLKHLDQKTDDIVQELTSSQLEVSKLINLQKEGFESILPKRSGLTNKIVSIELPTRATALSFPFYSESLRDEKGIYLGYTNTGSNIYFDAFQRGSYRKNSNAFVLGTSGAGKTTTVMKLTKDQVIKGTKAFIIDPEREYKGLCKKLGGDWVNFGSDKKVGETEEQLINPLQFFKEESDGRALLSSHLQFLEQFFETLFPEMSLVETNILKKTLQDLYKSKKITATSSVDKLKPKAFPVLSDLYKELKKNADKQKDNQQATAYSNLEIYFSCFASKESPESQLWNGHTNFDTSNSHFMVLDTHSLGESGNKRISNAQLFLLLKFLNNLMVQNKIIKESKEKQSTKMMIVIDEAHLLIDENNLFGLEFMYQMVKRARKYDTMTLITTQNVADFCGGSPAVQKMSSAIINTSQYAFLLGMNPGDIEALDKVYKSIGGLTALEKETLSHAETGTGILGIGPKERKIITIEVSDEELELLEH